jgi:transcriptional regulator with XRE-family HTH domain
MARLVHDLREGAGLSQAELARRVGSRQSAISRLERADYDGHSLAMLRRIARAVGCVVEIRVRPSEAPEPKEPNRKASARRKRAPARRKRATATA